MPARDRTFTVRTGVGKAVVLGTRFRVRTSGETMQVGVLEGRVAVSIGEISRDLIGGEIGQVAEGNLSIRRASSLDELRPRLGNFLAFQSTPLVSVEQEIEAHFELPVEIADPELGGRTVTASFQDASFAEVMSVVCRVTASPCSVSPSGAVIGERSTS